MKTKQKEISKGKKSVPVKAKEAKPKATKKKLNVEELQVVVEPVEAAPVVVAAEPVEQTPVIVAEPIEAAPVVVAVEPAVAEPVVVQKTFVERMIEGLTKKEIPGGRTIYVGDGGVRMEIIDGKLFNKGILKSGWHVKLTSGEKGKIHVDESRASIISGEADLSFSSSMSRTSEVEIIDPEMKEKVKEVRVEGDAAVAEDKKPAQNKQQYTFNGKSYTKSFLSREIVAKIVQDNPGITVAELEAKLPAPFMGKFGIFKELSAAKQISGNGLPRYFFKPEHIIKVGEESVAVCNQITTDKINAIISLARGLGYEIIEPTE